MALIIIIIGITFSYFRTELKDNIEGIESYSIFFESPSISYKLDPIEVLDKSIPTVLYEPNVNSFTGISIGLKHISLSASVQGKSAEGDSLKLSNLFDIQIQSHYKNILWEVYYQNYQGLYISDKVLDLTNELPKANSWSYGVSLKRFTNDDFKLEKSFSNFSKYKITNWSWVQGVSIGRSSLYSSHGLIPNRYAKNYSQLNGLTAFTTNTLAFEYGITGQWVFNRFFINSMVTLGINIQNQEFEGINQNSRVLTDSKSSTLLELGYDFVKSGSIGLSTRLDGYSIPVKNSRFTLLRTISIFYYKYFF